MDEGKVIARVPFRYNKKELERGELATLQGTPRDQQLMGLGYFLPFSKHEHEDKMCDNCGKHFCSESFYIQHKKKPGGCLAPSSPINKAETAMLLDVDPKKVRVEE